MSPQLSLAPGNSTESCILLVCLVNMVLNLYDDTFFLKTFFVHSQVDLDAAVNWSPKQQLDDSEDIEVIRIPIKSLFKVNIAR